MQNIVGMFETRTEAEAAINRLRAVGVGADSISIAMKDAPDPVTGEEASLAESTGTHDLAEEGTAVGAISGAAVGTLVGLLVAGSTFVLPGVGVFLIAGPLASALTGAGVGAASGGIFGALVGSGVPEPEATHYLKAFNPAASSSPLMSTMPSSPTSAAFSTRKAHAARMRFDREDG